MKNPSFLKGIILINVLIFAVIAIIVTLALINWAAATLRNSQQLASREQAFQVAEAGVDYYRWHLAHAQSDYTDGNSVSSTGPYVHDFKDKDGQVIGQFALTITPPPTGSTVVKIRSRGTVVDNPNVSRTIEATLAIPSLAKYAVAANDVMRFGVGTEVFGPIHSNNGIRFEGLAHNVITSAKDKYIDPDQGTHNPSWYQFGVYTTVNPNEKNTDSTPPTTVPNRPDVFMAGRQFPVPAIDFVGLTTNLSQMKSDAQANGKYFASSGSQGYQVILKTNDTFDLYRVTSLTNRSNACVNDNQDQANWGTWSIQNKQFIQNHPFPANGIIFVEDHVWVEGQVNTGRVTIAAGRFPDNPSTRRSITVNNDLTYTNYNGEDSIALIAQGDINAGLSSQNDLRIDAALVAQNGRVGRYYYSSDCGTGYTRSIITLYGMIASNKRYGFAYTDGTGYQTRDIIYDSNLLYAPPPSFPLTSSQYTTISWDEVK
ncbi:MAG: pilus assembly PilX N-terminal domain-containing protein [Patescibacteria group bacterium]